MLVISRRVSDVAATFSDRPSRPLSLFPVTSSAPCGSGYSGSTGWHGYQDQPWFLRPCSRASGPCALHGSGCIGSHGCPGQVFLRCPSAPSCQTSVIEQRYVLKGISDSRVVCSVAASRLFCGRCECAIALEIKYSTPL